MKIKTTYLMTVITLSLTALTWNAQAQEATTLGQDGSDAASSEATPLEGLMVGGTVAQSYGEVGVGVGVRYWSEYLGGDLTFAVEKASLDANGSDIFSQTSFGFGGAALVGFEINGIKPFFSLGFGYSKLEDDVANADIDVFSISPSVGVDFKATEHLVLGLGILSVPFTLSAEVNNTDVSGFSFAMLNSFSVAYLF